MSDECRYWRLTHKGNQRCRLLADRHYTRQHVGHPLWTRPGYNLVLYYRQANGREAVFCWWRPKWESGIERMDKLRCIECTIFRNQTRVRSSVLIREAVAALLTWRRAADVAWPDGLVTEVNAAATSGGRNRESLAGHCYRMAGFADFEHPGAGKAADVWLRFDDPLPAPLHPLHDGSRQADLFAVT